MIVGGPDDGGELAILTTDDPTRRIVRRIRSEAAAAAFDTDDGDGSTFPVVGLGTLERILLDVMLEEPEP